MFTLKIELGNQAMQTPRDVAEALRELAERLAEFTDDTQRVAGPIRDANGNSVGTYLFRAE